MKVHVKISLMMFLYMFIIIIILPIYDIPARLIVKNIDVMEDGWTASLNGETYEDVTTNNLKADFVPAVKKGEKISLSQTLSYEASFKHPAILVSANCCIISVSLDDLLLYSQAQWEEKKIIYIPGKSLHLIELPADYLEKELRIDYYAEDDFAFAGIIPPRLGERLELIRYIVYRGLRPLLVGIFMSIYGVLFVLISAFFSKKVPQIQGQVYAAAICILIGVWMLCYNEAFVLLYPGVNTTFMEVFCQFLSVPLFYVFLFRLNLPIKRKFEKYAAIGLSVSSLIIVVIWTVAENFTSLLMLFFIIILIFGLAIIARYYRSIHKTRNFDQSVFMQINGISIMMLCCLIQCILYYAEDFRGIPRGVFGRNVMSIGVSTLAVSQMLNFFFLVTKDVAGNSGTVPLAQIAYHDSLTGIYNRSKAEEVTQKLLHSKDSFCIIMMDLNGLKAVNDESGHLTGDHLLKEFAQVLRISLRKEAFYARIGGDEFIAIIENPAHGQVEELIGLVRAEFDKLNESEPGILHSFAAGYATSYEAETIYNLDGSDRDNVWKFTRKLADSRMYEQKNAMKKHPLVHMNSAVKTPLNDIPNSENMPPI